MRAIGIVVLWGVVTFGWMAWVGAYVVAGSLHVDVLAWIHVWGDIWHVQGSWIPVLVRVWLGLWIFMLVCELVLRRMESVVPKWLGACQPLVLGMIWFALVPEIARAELGGVHTFDEDAKVVWFMVEGASDRQLSFPELEPYGDVTYEWTPDLRTASIKSMASIMCGAWEYHPDCLISNRGFAVFWPERYFGSWADDLGKAGIGGFTGEHFGEHAELNHWGVDDWEMVDMEHWRPSEGMPQYERVVVWLTGTHEPFEGDAYSKMEQLLEYVVPRMRDLGWYVLVSGDHPRRSEGLNGETMRIRVYGGRVDDIHVKHQYDAGCAAWDLIWSCEWVGFKGGERYDGRTYTIERW